MSCQLFNGGLAAGRIVCGPEGGRRIDNGLAAAANPPFPMPSPAFDHTFNGIDQEHVRHQPAHPHRRFCHLRCQLRAHETLLA